MACTYKVTDSDGKPITLNGEAAFKAYLADGNLPRLMEGGAGGEKIPGKGGILFSKTKDGTPTLIVQHNLSEENLLHADRMGGIPVPSLAITKAEHPLENFGEITLVGGSDMADPKGYAATKVYGADIYSPRYPTITHIVKSSDTDRLNKSLSKYSDLTNSGGIYPDNIRTEGKKAVAENSAVRAKFLEDNGIEPKIVGNEAASISEHLEPFKNDTRHAFELAKDESFQKASKDAYLDDMRRIYESIDPTGEMAKEEFAKKEEFGHLFINNARAVEGYQRRRRDAGSVDRYKTGDSLRTQVEEAGLGDKYNEFVDKTFDSLNPEEKIFRGFTYTGNRKYIPHTLDNVIKILKKEMVGGEGFNYGVGTIRSKFTPQFKTLKAIQEAKSRLMDELTFDGVKAEIDGEFNDLADTFRTYHPIGNEFGFLDTLSSTLYDSATMGLPRAFRENGFTDVPEEKLKDAALFLDKLRNLPTQYFEAKILRAVDLSEFKGAVVPKNASQKSIDALNRRGITNIKYYDGRIAGDRAAKINELAKESDLLFSKKGGTLTNAHTPDTLRSSIAKAFSPKFVEKLEQTGRFVISTNESVKGIIGDVTQYSKDGRPLAFYDRDTGITHILAENIPKTFTERQIKGLLSHEIGEHALQLGKNDKEYQAIQRDLEQLIEDGDKDAVAARQRAIDADTPAADMGRETMGYLVEAAPQSSIVQRFMTWFKSAVNKALGPARLNWAYSPADMATMAQSALRRSPEMLGKAPEGLELASKSESFNHDPSPEEAEKVQSGIEGKTATEALKFIKNNATQPEHKLLAERILIQMEKMQMVGEIFTLKIAHQNDRVPAGLANSRGVVWRGFDSNVSDIWIQGNDVKGLVGTSYETVLHEMLHSVTQSAIYVGSRNIAKGTPLAKNVKDLYDVTESIINHLDKRIESANGDIGKLTEIEQAAHRGHNALNNPDEVVSWALTNKHMQDYLESIPYKNTTLWGKFVDSIRSMLGLPKEANTALSEVLRITDDLLNAPVMQVHSMMKTLHPPTVINQQQGLLNESNVADKQPPAIPEETRFQKTQRIIQDKLNRFTVIKEWLAEQGVKLSEAADVYKAEERMHSKFANQAEDFREKRVAPLIQKIQKAGFSMDAVSEFLHAQHAEERNKQIAKINPEKPDSGSGMDTEKAREILKSADPKLVSLANEFRQITVDTRDMMLREGIISQEMADAWDAAYKHYVPLKGGPDEEVITGTGKGLKVKRTLKRAMGHGEREGGEWIIENILADYERALMLVEKNRVGQSLIRMIMEIGREDIGTIGKPEKRGVIKPDQAAYVVNFNGSMIDAFHSLADAQLYVREEAQKYDRNKNEYEIEKVQGDPVVTYMASPMLADNEVNVYVKGHAIRVQINDDLLARAYGNMGAEALNTILKAGRALNGFLSKIYTGYNPEFIATNIVRDLSTGVINITGEQGIAFAGKSLLNYAGSFKDLLVYAATGKETKWITDYRADGGNTGAAYLSDLERLGSDIKTEYSAYLGVMANLSKGDYAGASRAAGRTAFNHTLKWIEHLNQAGENAMRLSIYKAARESNQSRNKASSLAKNSTVNFNRKGERGAQANALYLFFNAGVQGVAAFSHAHFKGEHKWQARALSASVAGLGYLIASALGGGDEDEYDKLSDYTKSHNLVIKSGNGWVKIPVPYEYGFFWNLGRTMADAARKDKWGKMPWQVASSFVEGFTPFGNVVAGGNPDSKSLLYLTPTVMQLTGAPIVNRTGMGGPIMPEGGFDKSQPDRDKMWRTTKGTMYDRLAGALEKVGADVSPETLKHYTRSLTGGAGALVDTSISSAMLKSQGADLEVKEMPFVRKFYGETSISDSRRAYYEARDEAKSALEELNRAKKSRDMSRVGNVITEKRELIAMAKYADHLSKLITATRNREDQVRLSDMPVAEKRLKLKEMESQEEKIYDRYLHVFKEKTKHH